MACLLQHSRQPLHITPKSPRINAKGYVMHPCLGSMLNSPAAKLCGQEISDRILLGLGVYVRKFSAALADGANEGMTYWSVHRIQLLIGGSPQQYAPCLLRAWKLFSQQAEPASHDKIRDYIHLKHHSLICKV